MSDPLKEKNLKIRSLTLEQIRGLSDKEIIELAMERPGHPGEYGFLLDPSLYRSEEHLAATLHALLMRLQKAMKLSEQ
jgi:hypothetical protein